MSVNALTVFVAALLTALATGLGALPLLFRHDTDQRALGLASAAASGVMAAASVSLFVEGVDRSVTRSVVGVLAGAVFVLVVSRVLRAPGYEHDFGALRGDDAVKALLIVAVMTVHSGGRRRSRSRVRRR